MHLIFYLTRRVYSVNRIEIKFRLPSNVIKPLIKPVFDIFKNLNFRKSA